MNKLIDCFRSTDFDNRDNIMNTYDIMTISYFDHYLSKEEYSNAELVCHSDIQGDSKREKLFKDIENRFIKLYKSLYYLSNERVTIYIDGSFYQSESYEKYKLFVTDAMKERPLCQFLYPSLMMFSTTGYDLTHDLFFLKDNSELVFVKKMIGSLVNSVRLNIL